MAPLDKVRPNGDLLSLRVIEKDTTGGDKVLTYEGGRLGGGSQCLKGTIIAGAASFVLQVVANCWPTTTKHKINFNCKVINSTTQC